MGYSVSAPAISNLTGMPNDYIRLTRPSPLYVIFSTDVSRPYPLIGLITSSCLVNPRAQCKTPPLQRRPPLDGWDLHATLDGPLTVSSACLVLSNVTRHEVIVVDGRPYIGNHSMPADHTTMRNRCHLQESQANAVAGHVMTSGATPKCVCMLRVRSNVLLRAAS